MSLTRKQQMIVARVRRAMADAKREGLVTFCDVESWGIRFVSDCDIVGDDADPRTLGDVVPCSEPFPDAATLARDGDRVQCASACGTPEGSNL